MNQSPIRLMAETALRLAVPPALLWIEYDSHTAYTGTFVVEHGHPEFRVRNGPTIRFRRRLFRLVKVHVHAAAEHAVEVDHPRPPFEVHLVHVPEGGTSSDPKVVIGILYHPTDDKTARPGLDEFARIVPSLEALAALKAGLAIEGEFVPGRLFPPLHPSGEPDFVNWFHYEGSLTSFPYSEDVSWFVMRDEAAISTDLVGPLHDYAMHEEARELQPLDRRLTVRSFISSADG